MPSFHLVCQAHKAPMPDFGCNYLFAFAFAFAFGFGFALVLAAGLFGVAAFFLFGLDMDFSLSKAI